VKGCGEQVQSTFRRFAFLYAVLIALSVAAAFAFLNPIYWWWVERFEGPLLQSEFGFTAERRTIPFGGATYSALVIVSVAQGGRFERAGVRSGDTTACLYHSPAELWSHLLAARHGQPTRFKVLSYSDLARGCEGSRTVSMNEGLR